MLNFFKKNKSYKLHAVVSGNSINIEKVNDSVFSKKLMGDGVAIIPNSNVVVAPCNGKVTVLTESKHAFGIVSDEGVEILVHIGIDTVSLQGEGFKNEVSQGDTVKKGSPIISFEREKINSQGIDCTTIIIVLNHSEFSEINCMVENEVVAGQDTVIEIMK
ncbi:TPA: PTS glucose transporter subunit IIA [Clostridioides difficile]|uniref:PTS sugar transporter subunit IIA n=1 Tax=Clostridioides difficile TaxID=1496 RepID=UPI001C299829|nr:PTS glucose transporter subunit IIA [Clostridioides difficile]MCJ0150915.1 PTS glucose transporter subunit IIA [Clostridioides difficile]MCJ0348822.1 PTS glucose transporter subunit IIA [Clostridioides difficile]MDB0370727.1 PTS glucose transporter subunit IIA [Clostridioides difficile]MDB3230881.1 PTS glucose transporter subunit IIA [Clostridioides difficile]MDC9222902.1 PTS glucose transporter subunit IIA [Clostridioides difficile]